MHREAYQYVYERVRGMNFGSVVEFGSLDINGSVRGLFDADHYHGIDLQRGPGVDEVADAVTWRAENPVDAIVCCEVLEHAPDVSGVIESASANLKRGGLFFMTCATDPRAPHSAVDGGKIREGEHYENVDTVEFTSLLSLHGFMLIHMAVHTDRGDLYALAKKI